MNSKSIEIQNKKQATEKKPNQPIILPVNCDDNCEPPVKPDDC
jgi:hypothetical protein